MKIDNLFLLAHKIVLLLPVLLATYLMGSESAVIEEFKKREQQTIERTKRINYTAQHLPPLHTFLDLALQKHAFKESVTKPRIHEPNTAIKELNPIVPWNKKLVWNQDKSRILMTTFMNKDSFNKLWAPIQKGQPKIVSFEGWVTALPELKEFGKEFLEALQQKPDTKGFKDYQIEDIVSMRIQQYLGLAPTLAEKVIVEVWVKPEDLIRPCLDTEIVDTSCVLDLPKEQLPADYKDIWKFVRAVPPKYHAWFTARKEGSQVVPAVYEPEGLTAVPWTRLGFAFDWGKPSDKHFGAGEYVIKNKDIFGAAENPTIIFEKVYNILEYLNRPKPIRPTEQQVPTAAEQQLWQGL